MATNALKKITTAAKSLRRKHPKMTWKAAIKKAGAAYRAGPAKRKTAAKKRAAPKKKVAPKKRIGAYKVLEAGERGSTPGKIYRNIRQSNGRILRTEWTGAIAGTRSVASMTAALKSVLLEELGRLEVRKFTARLKRDKTKIQKLITAKKTQLRRLAK